MSRAGQQCFLTGNRSYDQILCPTAPVHADPGTGPLAHPLVPPAPISIRRGFSAIAATMPPPASFRTRWHRPRPTRRSERHRISQVYRPARRRWRHPIRLSKPPSPWPAMAPRRVTAAMLCVVAPKRPRRLRPPAKLRRAPRSAFSVSPTRRRPLRTRRPRLRMCLLPQHRRRLGWPPRRRLLQSRCPRQSHRRFGPAPRPTRSRPFRPMHRCGPRLCQQRLRRLSVLLPDRLPPQRRASVGESPLCRPIPVSVAAR